MEIPIFSLIGVMVVSTKRRTIAVFLHISQQLLNGSVTGQQVVNAPSIVDVAYGAGGECAGY